MKASLLLVATLLLFGILDGICPKMCHGRDVPLNFHQVPRERMALETVQRLKFSGGLFSRLIYPPPPRENLARAQEAPRPKIPPPPQELTPSLPPPPPPPPPPPSYRCIPCIERGGNRGMIP
ncbi:hypothetical protein CCACVL1_17974 [Corchorus capsularis]|uniref:Uncharacterized protein n=1 Tax=Corchorus capsularis TaxID=210143 RepID=A0A1R3HNX3_COCAP|nr:hypothetical protein CCACVL1_17974 [Corchorus capsularis]